MGMGRWRTTVEYMKQNKISADGGERKMGRRNDNKV